MIIRRLKIERFRCLADFDRELGPGVTVVRGPNESGKSTVMEAILAAFFDQTGADNARVRGFGSWGRELRPRIRLELETASGPAVLDKDFDAKKTTLQAGDRAITAPRAAAAWIAEELGCSSLELFLATAGIREEDMGVPGVTRNNACSREIVSRLQAMLTGGPGGSPVQVMQRLKKRMEELRKKPAARPLAGRTLEENQRQLDDFDRRLKKLRQEMNALDLREAEKEKIKDRLQTIALDLETAKSVMGSHRLLIQAEEKSQALRERLLTLSRARERQAELDLLAAGLARYPGYDRLGPELERLHALQSEGDQTENSLTELSRQKFQPAAGRSRVPGLLGLGASAAAAAAVAAAGWWRSGWPLLGLAAAAALGLTGWWISGQARSRERARRRDMDQIIGDAEDRLIKIEHEINEIVRKFGRVSAADCLAAHREYQELVSEVRGLERAVADLSAGETPGTLDQRIGDLTLELRLEQDRIRELSPYRIADPVRYRSLERDIAGWEEERGRLSGKQVELEVRIAEADYNPEELAALEEERADLERSLQYWERQYRVHDKARAVLAEATTAVMGRAGEVIQREMTPYIARVTRGRYQEVRADNELNLALFSGPRGDWVSGDELSHATRDQLHLGARLALVGLITGNKKPPLLLDDPFAHFDDDRLDAAMDLLHDFARDRQVIIFAPTDRYDPAADRIIVLGPETPEIYYRS